MKDRPTYIASCSFGKDSLATMRIKTLVEFRRKHPELWGELLELGKTPNLCSYGFKYGKTVEEINARLDFEDKQLTLF